MKRIPLNAFAKAMYNLLSTYQTTPVFDDVPDDVQAPYITFGLFTSKDAGTKTSDISDSTLTIDIWSDYNGKKEVNEIANDVIEVLNTGAFTLDDDFKFISGQVDFFESFAEDDAGYHGVITYLAKIKNIKE